MIHEEKQPIKLHILICFKAMVISKHIEIKADISIKKFLKESKKIVDGQILNHITHKTFSVKAQQTPKMNKLIAK